MTPEEELVDSIFGNRGSEPVGVLRRENQDIHLEGSADEGGKEVQSAIIGKELLSSELSKVDFLELDAVKGKKDRAKQILVMRPSSKPDAFGAYHPKYSPLYIPLNEREALFCGHLINKAYFKPEKRSRDLITKKLLEKSLETYPSVHELYTALSGSKEGEFSFIAFEKSTEGMPPLFVNIESNIITPLNSDRVPAENFGNIIFQYYSDYDINTAYKGEDDSTAPPKSMEGEELTDILNRLAALEERVARPGESVVGQQPQGDQEIGGLKVGRQRRTGPSSQFKPIQFNLNVELIDRIKGSVKTAGVSQSALVEQAVSDFLDQNYPMGPR